MNTHQTRARILDAAGRIIHEQGYANTGLSAILAEAEVPKGSFYHHFQSKEHLALELVDHYIAQLAGRALPFLEDTSLPPLARLRAMFDSLRHAAESREFRLGCPLGKLVQEMAEINEPVRLRLRSCFQRLHSCFAGIMQEAMKAGELDDAADPDALAHVILDGWQGALLRMKLERDPRPLDAFLGVLFGQVLRPHRQG